MKLSDEKLFNPFFAHIYIEKQAAAYELTKNIIKHFSKATCILIDDYKEVFDRSHQSFALQKHSPSLILAVKKGHLIYPGAPVCQDFGNTYFYYTSTIMNCLYQCEYCYLQGMYPSADMVLFVNLEDIFEAVCQQLEKHPLYLCISYDTDLLALEPMTHQVDRWYDFACQHPDLKMELRTKSAHFNALKDKEPIEQLILAWTLSPQRISSCYEKRTPSLMARLQSCSQAVEAGWPVRLCFDPLLYVPDWQSEYDQLVEEVFQRIDGSKLLDVSIGTFRTAKEYLKKMRKLYPASSLLQYPFETAQGVCSYPEWINAQMISRMKESISRFISPDKIYL